MTKRGQKFGKVLFVSMLLTLTIALGGGAGDKEEEGSSQVGNDTGSRSGSRDWRQLRLPMEKHRRLQLVFHRI